MEFLKISRTVTENYIKAQGEWSTTDQWNKIDEEDLEFRNATSKDNELEEFWDKFFAPLTLLHLEKFNDDEILDAGIKCWNKIHEHSQKTLSNIGEVKK